MKTLLRILLPLVLLGLGVLVTVVLIRTKPEVKPAPREAHLPLVRVKTVTPQPHRYTVATQGTVSPHLSIDLVAEAAGRIVRVSPAFEAGEFFAEGEELVTLDTRDYELAVTRAKAQLAEAQVRFTREQAEADVAVAEWETLGEGEPSALVRREPQLAEARAAVESAEAALSQAELDLERCHIRAPFAGRVWQKNADLGQYMARGTALARIYSTDFAEVHLPLPLEDLAYLDLSLRADPSTNLVDGPKVTLSAQVAGQPNCWFGRIVRTQAEIDPRTRMITAVARVRDPFGRKHEKPPLPIGLFVNAEIEGVTTENAYLIPRAALRGRDEVILVDESNRLRFQQIGIARLEQNHVIVSEGLRPGDRVCISVLETPVDGMQVRVAMPEEAAGTTPTEPSASASRL